MLLFDVSIRWRILLFFCLLGLLPQVIISYFSVDAYTDSLEQTYDRQVSQLLQQAAEQTSTKTRHRLEDLVNYAAQPYLQLSFQQYPQSTRLQLLRERLELFRFSRGIYTRLNLRYLNGEPLIVTKNDEPSTTAAAFERRIIAQRDQESKTITQELFQPAKELAFFVPVHSFRHPSKIVGYMIAYLPVSTLTTSLEKLELGPHASKSILTGEGDTISSFQDREKAFSAGTMREFSAQVEPLGWSIRVSISEEELLRDVILLKRKNIIFIAATIILAFTLSFFLSHRFTRPFKEIISGTRKFATGNLDHRIQVHSGHEAKQLAGAFNDMADELNKRQQELNQAVRLASLGVMTAGIGHEIKNPLAGIKTSAQVIDKIIPTDAASPNDRQTFEEMTELARGISDEADRMTKILNDLLQFGRPREPKAAPFDIADIISHGISLIQAKFEKKGVRLLTDVSFHRAVADPDQILQVILNLLLNGLEAVAAQTGEVRIRTQQLQNGRVSVTIADNGRGIAEDKIPHIFDPFYSLREDGTGLGLSVVYTLLKQNNGGLEVNSTQGEGATFIITLEAEDSAERERIHD